MSAAIAARDGRPVTLRPATDDDMMTLFAWQQLPAVRRHARNPKPPTLAEHSAWYRAHVRSPDCRLCIIDHGAAAAGMLRLDRRFDRTAECWEVSILVAPERQGLGIAAAALRLGRALLPTAHLVAEVLAGNEASQWLFRAAGYRLEPDGRYHLRPEPR